MNTKVDQKLKILRLGAIEQEKRRQAAVELGEILDSEDLIAAAKELRKISRGEADFVQFNRLQIEDGELWKHLNEALAKNGYPPATTLREAFQGIGNPSPRQIGDWYGENAVIFIQELLEQQPSISALLTYIEILGSVSNEHTRSILLKLNRENQNINVARKIAAVLGQYEGDQVLSTLESILKEHRDPFTRINAGVSLIKLGEIDTVVKAIKQEADKFIQLSAAKALVKSADKHPEALEHISNVAKEHPNFMVRNAAYRKLGELQSKQGFQLLSKMLQAEGYSGRLAIIEALEYYGEPAIPVLVKALDDEELPEWATKRQKPSVGKHAEQAINRIKSKLT